MNIELETKLEAAIDHSVGSLGIGGFVRAKGIAQAFDEIDATTFAKIMYATDAMLYEFHGQDASNPKHIQPTISKLEHEFVRDLCFQKVEAIFRDHFGPDILRLASRT